MVMSLNQSPYHVRMFFLSFLSLANISLPSKIMYIPVTGSDMGQNPPGQPKGSKFAEKEQELSRKRAKSAEGGI
jgi:hypothetical protein